MALTDLIFPLNPDYGTGIARRRIRLINTPGQVDATLCDIFHEMQCRVTHDGARVTAIEGKMLRIPTSLCCDAAAVLRELIGMPLQISFAEIYAGGRAKHHCTHLFDLAVLAIRHASRAETERVYDAVVPDETDAPVIVELARNNIPIHTWKVFQGNIIEPAAINGRPLLQGFAAWAAQVFAGDELEAAMVLSKTCLIARGRTVRSEAWKDDPLTRNSVMAGACYSYTPERMANGVFLGNNERDFSERLIEGS
jgi:hypothetical protein